MFPSFKGKALFAVWLIGLCLLLPFAYWIGGEPDYRGELDRAAPMIGVGVGWTCCVFFGLRDSS